ncbi:putative TIR domain, P-loop containing nucleoside triphosphate hydrolase [Rosa chinensis]|uniref:Putative TIR domain, P-loop containing nucleoside triphosphate hydrolase n=1 Tax=Rosa chinensis TaxID=74649 RepID=A0A2P6QP72_ROSCH|nr:putative TIR domain, P-loop containing nucleoside triphosphate hydrolase [Rosa chinensis]
MASLTTAAASSSSSSLPCSSPNHQNHYTYEVFLSFRGEDTRFNFTDHLHSRLCERGIETFIDDELRRGEEISAALVKAIEESRVSIIVFSQNYASSRWCLDELVDPSDVRHQSGAFGDAFATLDQCKYEDSMGKWKAALNEAADLSGWPFKDGESEAKFIKKIIDELSARVVNPSCELHVTEHPIGLESCRQDVNRLLHVEEDIVRMVGIWGPGGIGKTTIVKDVFNSIRHKFEGSCFLADVRSKSSDLAQLQETLLFDLLRDRELKVCNVDVGVSLIKTRMRNKKVFLILDDVSHFSQLQNLIPSPDCFGPGSRILITTRDKRWLIAHQVDDVYEVKMLNDRQAMNLFSLNAFKRNRPPGDYLKLAQCAVCYAQGLPLALIVLGSHLFGRSREEWEATLDSCRGEDPHREIRDVLKISYDALGEDLKGYFLDIACFFKDEEVDHVKPILDACYDVKSVNGIAQLQEKALIRIDKDWKGCRIWMHDLIEEMGKDIVYQESPDEPGERSRVWNEEDVNDILTNNTGTNKVIGIQVPWLSSTTSLNAKSFSGMTKLRYISMRGMMKYESFSRDIDYLSNQLRWLDWPKCPLQCFPSDFHANKLVNLDISGSRRITQLWEGRKNFSRLTCMNLRGCESLTELPDFSGIPNLNELDLCDCKSLVEVHDSVGFLPNLVILNLRGCESLTELPDLSGIPNLKELDLYYCKSLVGVPDSLGFLYKLVTLNVGGCSNLLMFPRKINLKSLETISIYCCKLKEFSKIGEGMSFLRKLDLSGTCIKELDESIGNLTGLEVLNLDNCRNFMTLPCSIYELQDLRTLTLYDCSKLVRFPRKINILNVDGCSQSFPKLQALDIGGCSLSDCDFLMTLDCWETLEYLSLSRNNFVSLPACITKFVKLRWLFLEGCKRLQEIPELPPKVKVYSSLIQEASPSSRLSLSLDPSMASLAALSLLSPSLYETDREPTPVNPPKRQRTGASMVHFAYELTTSPIPMFPDLHSAHHSTTTP